MAEQELSIARNVRPGDIFHIGDGKALRATRVSRRNECPWPSEVIDIDYVDASGVLHGGSFDPAQAVQILKPHAFDDLQEHGYPQAGQ